MPNQTLELQVTLENGQFKVASKQVADGIKKTGANTDKATKSFSKMGLAMKGLALGAGALIVKFFKDSVRAASNLQEVTSKFRTVFAGNMAVANEAVKELTESYAMSTREAREYLSSIQDLLVPMGMSSDEAAKMSANVVKLSADLGSFNNLPTAQVMADIQSALVGNFETMKKYGVVLNETVIKQEALEQGVWDGKGAIDAATKSQVAYSLVVKGSQAAIGDMERTADSYANSMKRMEAASENAASAIGNSLLPVLTKLSNVATAGFDKITEVMKQSERHGKAMVKLESMKARIQFDEMSTLEQIKWTRETLNQLLSHELWLEKQIAVETDKKQKKETKKKGGGGVVRKGKQYEPKAFEAFEERKRMLGEYHGVKLTLEEDDQRREAERQMEAASLYESHLKSKLGMDTKYYAGLQTVANTSSVFMAQKNKKLFRFGQVLAIAQTIMSTQQGMIKAYAQLGPIAGVAGAAVVAAAGALSVKNITKQKPPEFAVGSMNVPNTGPAVVHQGEIIVPKTMADSVRSGDASLTGGGGGGGGNYTFQVDGKTFFEINEVHRDEAAQNMGSQGSFAIDSPY